MGRFWEDVAGFLPARPVGRVLRDRSYRVDFVAGFDPRCEGFFWLAGQGGYGVGSAPAMAALTRYLVSGAEPRGDFARVMQYFPDVAPDRLLNATTASGTETAP